MYDYSGSIDAILFLHRIYYQLDKYTDSDGRRTDLDTLCIQTPRSRHLMNVPLVMLVM